MAIYMRIVLYITTRRDISPGPPRIYCSPVPRLIYEITIKHYYSHNSNSVSNNNIIKMPGQLVMNIYCINFIY